MADHPEHDLLRSRRKLLDAIEAFPKAAFGTHDVSARLAAYRRAHEIVIIEPIHRQGKAASDPLDNSLLTLAGNLMQLQFESSELVLQARAILETGSAANIDTPIEDRLRIQLQIVNGLVKICRALDRNK